MRLESRARATRKIFGIASRAGGWGAKGRAIVSRVRRVEVGSGSGDILTGGEQRRRHGGWVNVTGPPASWLDSAWLKKLTLGPHAVETGGWSTCGSEHAQPARKAAGTSIS